LELRKNEKIGNLYLELNHIKTELAEERQKLDDIVNRPTKEIQTQTDIKGEDLKQFADNT